MYIDWLTGVILVSGNKEPFPQPMTFKTLIIYIIVTVLICLVFFLIRNDSGGKIGIIVVCPLVIGYLIYAYNKEKKADSTAINTNKQMVEGDYFKSGEWHTKYTEYINSHPFERPLIMNMKKDLLKRYKKRELFMMMLLFLFLMFCSVVSLSLGRYVISIIGIILFGALFYMELREYIGMPVRKWLKGDIDYDALEESYLNGQMLHYKGNGLIFGTTHIHAYTAKKVYAIDYRLVEDITRKIIRLKTYEDGIYSSEEYRHYAVIHVRLPVSGAINCVEIELNEFQVQMAIDYLSNHKYKARKSEDISLTEDKENITV